MDYVFVDRRIRLRFAEKEDAALLVRFIYALAEYESLLDRCYADEDGLKRFMFEEKKAEALICEYDETPVGFALFFHNFSTFLGKAGIYVEDLFVLPEFRKRSLGRSMLAFLANLAVERGCSRLEWACLDWNEPSIAFYKKLGAQPLSEWTTYRVSGEELQKLAGTLNGACRSGRDGG
ncbi:MAG: GNAT family N-acetyltransferase [Helicobacteraceae bacterium]|jgi:GNAT superfamily N-acetyltransferase|nr:GNAT family N-acetyltransferase [Helicobacteraceae bacterium]